MKHMSRGCGNSNISAISVMRLMDVQLVPTGTEWSHAESGTHSLQLLSWSYRNYETKRWHSIVSHVCIKLLTLCWAGLGSQHTHFPHAGPFFPLAFARPYSCTTMVNIFFGFQSPSQNAVRRSMKLFDLSVKILALTGLNTGTVSLEPYLSFA